MASRRPLAWIAGALAELPVGDTVAGHAWYFGSGEPNAAAGAVGDYYVEANNRLWVKGASTWTYTGVQLGSPANVDGKAVLVDADVLSIGDSANDLQMRRVTVAEFRSQFLTTALADAAASPDLPSTSAATWQSIVQTLRDGLKWVISRFNSSGRLSVEFGGTGTNDLANLPVSAAQQAALNGRLEASAGNWTPLQYLGLGDAHGFTPGIGYRVYFLDSNAANRPPIPQGHDGPLEVYCYGPDATDYNFLRFHDWRTNQSWTQSQTADGWGPWARQATLTVGAWTPRLVGSNSGAKTPAAANAGYYIKIGNSVHVFGTVAWDGGTAIDGLLQLSGLPYPTTALANGRAAGALGGNAGITSDAGYSGLALIADPGGLEFAYVVQTSGSGYSHTPAVNSSGAIYGIGLTYLTDV